MSDNTLVCIVCCVAIAGCSTCAVSQHRREVDFEKIRVEERLKIIQPENDQP